MANDFRSTGHVTVESIRHGVDKVVSHFDLGARAVLFVRLGNGAAAIVSAVRDPETSEVVKIIGAFRFNPARVGELDRAVHAFASTLARS